MPLILSISLFIVGAILGAAANFLIYSQRIERRPISPWMLTDLKASARRWFDYVPIFGWLSMRREVSVFGTGFWVRPLLVELLMGVGVVALYRYEVVLGGLLPAAFLRPFDANTLSMLHYQFAAHVVLIFFMTVASLIDADETIIPDSVTVTGTLIGLAIAAFLPWSLLPSAVYMYNDGFSEVVASSDPLSRLQLDFMHFTSPNVWSRWLDRPFFSGLSVGLACWLLWCFALLPRTWYPRHGLLRAVQLCSARIRREMFSWAILLLAIFGIVAIAICWHHGGENWAGLLTAIVGMAAGGGMIWAVRIIGSAAMRREAMGFGDVTLMAMIGAFVGWQGCIVIFFLAPFAALVVGLLRLVLFRQREIPYGPFLCLATLATILYWDAVWDRTQDIFALGWYVPLAIVACFPVMYLLLYGSSIVKRCFGR